MKRIPVPLWITLILLCGLLLSTVLAQTGAYTISAWVVAGGGGGSTGGVYGLDGTIGQAGVGRVSGGVYTLDSGYWALDETTPGAPPDGSRRAYLPLVDRSNPPTPTRTPLASPTPTPTVTPIVTLACNDPKNNEGEDLARPFIYIGQACIGSFTNPPGEADDWYYVDLNPGQIITVDMTVIPVGDNYDVYLYIKGKDTPVAQPANHATRTETFTYQAQTKSRYYVRVYDKTSDVASAKTYILKVVVQ